MLSFLPERLDRECAKTQSAVTSPLNSSLNGKLVHLVTKTNKKKYCSDTQLRVSVSCEVVEYKKNSREFNFQTVKKRKQIK